MGPRLMSDKDVLRIWERMMKRQPRIRTARSPPIYSVGQTVKISKEKMRFGKGYEKNWTLALFRISKA